MTRDTFRVGTVVSSPLLPEPIEIVAIVPLGDTIKLIGKSLKTSKLRDPDADRRLRLAYR